MFLRFAAAACAVLAIGLACSSERAAAQGYPYVYRGAPPAPPPPYALAPDNRGQESVVMVPDSRSGLPYPERRDRYVPAAPGFLYPEEPAPYGHMPGRDGAIQRSEL